MPEIFDSISSKSVLLLQENKTKEKVAVIKKRYIQQLLKV
jgi:hypothetical protein